MMTGHDDGPLTFKETLHSTRRNRLPKADFKLTILLPRVAVAVLDEIVLIKVQLEHDTESYQHRPSI